jgi:hypothetical protein
MVSCLAFVSCQDERNEPVATGNTIRVRFDTPDFVQLGTRVANETTIKDVTVLQYKDGILVKKIYLSNKVFAQPVDIDGLVDIDATALNEDGTIDNDNEVNILAFLANVGDVTDVANDDADGDLFDKGISTYDQLLTYTQELVGDAAAKAQALATMEYMPMTGFYYGGIVANVANQINVTLKRVLARINFTLNTDYFKVDGERVSTIVRSIALHNVPDVITFFPANRPTLPKNGIPGVWFDQQMPYPATTGTVIDEDDVPDATNFFTLDVEANLATNKSKGFLADIPENARGSYNEIKKNADKIPQKINDPVFETLDKRLGLTYIWVNLEYETSKGKVGEASYKIYLGGDAAGDMNLLANTQYNITTYLYGIGQSDTRITIGNTFDPTVTGGTEESKVKPLANSYIVNNDDDFIIPLVQARSGWRYIDNTFRLKSEETNYTDQFDAMITSGNWEIVTLWRTWQDDTHNVTGAVVNDTEVETDELSDGYKYYAKITIPNGISLGNNCVIALREMAGDKIIWWTWHLWFTDYNPDNLVSGENGVTGGQIHKYFSEAFTPSGVYDGKRMMDRNLGATVTGVGNGSDISQPNSTADAVKLYGLMYQWGRKDPFTNVSDVPNTVTINNATPIYAPGSTDKIAVSNGSTIGKSSDDENLVADDTGNSADGFPKVNNKSYNKYYRVIDAIRYPKSYFHSGGSSNDWTEQDDNLWKMNVKSVFDPCPPGWRVPAGGTSAAYNPWAGFGKGLYNSPDNVVYGDYWATTSKNGPFPWYAQIVNGTAGRWYGITDGVLDKDGGSTTNYTKNSDGTAPAWWGGDKAWYPASGLRVADSGAFNATGSNGSAWSCAPTGANACHLYYFSTVVYPSVSSGSRCAGLSVRCVQN